MKHFLEISQLARAEIDSLLKRALYFKNSHAYPDYSQYTVANLFYENSTRTRVSFELAAKRLAMTVINLNLQSSSELKGEVVEDTVNNLAAMGIDLFVIRHSQDGLQQRLANQVGDKIRIANAGDGQHAHPSQALLDFMTIYEQKPDLSQLKIAIIGNIRHSRVANSLQCLCATLGVKELSLIAPDIWQPRTIHFGHVTDSLVAGLQEADVVICLRVQQERLQEHEHLDLETYRQKFALTKETLKFAKTDALVMHPGPMNRGVEIDSDVADGPQSFILQQVTNGVFMRMAILEALATNEVF
ncbi:aspartate carbamoyltransferase catalytic subunit [Legionella cardiaca]|uniref:Aspartate carbamoyltransferase n=1 Tax=Legionella cardiaca TaxID=1071983 RepID=A0ABY8AT05_9GAMM|nr:aspartate carbamoyltransferase catalytic subunit [Legionella cardiaca]WED43604.1 aspartate carbamoyltransferase catalytic subunit [Legionella cardiaca]